MKHIAILLLVLLWVSPVNNQGVAADEAPAIISESAILMDAKTGQVLYEKNMNEKLYPASITKILTILLGIEKGHLDDTVTMSHEAVFTIPRGASHIALDEGEQITLEQALMAALLPSANDACNGIAEHISGNVSDFAQLMNQRARESGALNSNFVNPHGLPDDKQVTTAYDMAMITRAALQNEKFRAIISTVRYTIPPTNKQTEPRELWSEHRMLTTNRFSYQGVIGGKTGYTKESQNTLVTAGRRGDRELIAVVMRSEDFGVYKDTIALFDYGFNEFVAQNIPIPAATVNASQGQDETQAIQSILNQNQNLSINRLLHKEVKPEDVVVDYKLMENSQQTKPGLVMNIHLKDANNLMYSDLGTVYLYGVGAPSGSDRWDWTSTALKVVKIILSVVLGLIALLFMVRWFFKIRRNIRRRKSRSRYKIDRYR
ncbi:MAG TPA: D-alanyl-D-alanine carboxypeptidase family protein [Syntrophomonadaceae bacterium]|nr:D-alanyl-D-alanine carboxypeptidase family protein [Syntrophomonadaceae bacterium]